MFENLFAHRATQRRPLSEVSSRCAGWLGGEKMKMTRPRQVAYRLLLVFLCGFPLLHPMRTSIKETKAQCAMHGDGCTCPPQMCHMNRRTEAQAADKPCHDSSRETSVHETEPTSPTESACFLQGCPSESAQKATFYRYIYLPTAMLDSTYAPIGRETLPEELVRSMDGSLPPPYHPPKAQRL